MTQNEIERFIDYVVSAIERDPGLIGDLIDRVDLLMDSAGPTKAAATCGADLSTT